MRGLVPKFIEECRLVHCQCVHNVASRGVGVHTFDASKKNNFVMQAQLM